MKVKVIGSGSMWTKYNSACYLIDDNIMVDIPNGACKYLYRFNIEPSSIEHILITHFHGDHYFDMPFYLLNKSKSDNKKVNVYCEKQGEEKINKIGELAFPQVFNLISKELTVEYNFEDEFTVEKYQVKRVLVDHGRIKPCFGYIIDNESNKVGFTGDTTLCSTVEEMTKTCKYLFCDCMLINGTNKHQGINDIEYLANKYPNCTFVVSHLNDDTRKVLEEKNISNVIVPNDGLELKI